MPVVGTLTVDLVANTATFTADLGKAGNSLDGFGKSAADAGDKIDYSMREARGSLMLVGEEFGIHLPREIRTMIAEIPAIGVALEALLPIMGAVFAVKFIVEFVEKQKEAAAKLSEAWSKSGETTGKVMGDLEDKLLAVGIKSDELAGNHLAALKKQLELLDHEELKDIVEEFDKLAKAANGVFGLLKTHWYSTRVGSEGAKHALDEFQAKYNELLSVGKDQEASDLLRGTLDSANASLKAMQSAGFVARGLGEASKEGVQSQHALIDALNAQIDVERQLAEITQGKKGNARTEEANKETEEQAKKYEAQQRGLEQRRRAEERYAKSVEEIQKKAAKESEDIAEEELRATTAVMEGQAKIQEDLNKETLKQALAMAKLKEDAAEQDAKHSLLMRRTTAQQATEAEIKAANDAARIEQQSLDQQIASLNKHDANYLVLLQQFENKKKQIIQQNENQVNKIREQAEEKQYLDIRRAQERMTSVIASNVARSLVEGKNMAKGFEDMGKQMLSAATENFIKMMLLDDMKQAKDAGHAAASAFKWVMQDVPFPANAIIAPIAAGAAFAGVMAFEQGGMIPGTGPKPIIGHGGETVVTKALTDRVEASEGKGSQRPVTIVQNIQTKDADSFKSSQSQLHSKAFHAATTAAKRNR